mmetsp:Transcript_17115/g.24733  ORF Transcript_17115/g.24733 Transcript_17115/m.24733 type:complete len:186 (+) Transcript_17115:109-666(+)
MSFFPSSPLSQCVPLLASTRLDSTETQEKSIVPSCSPAARVLVVVVNIVLLLLLLLVVVLKDDSPLPNRAIGAAPPAALSFVAAAPKLANGFLAKSCWAPVLSVVDFNDFCNEAPNPENRFSDDVDDDVPLLIAAPNPAKRFVGAADVSGVEEEEESEGGLSAPMFLKDLLKAAAIPLKRLSEDC